MDDVMEVDQASKCMELENSTLNALEIFDLNNDKSNTTLYGLLNKCRTSGGRELLKSWLKNPLRDLEKLNERFDVLDALITSANCRHELHNNYLRKVAQISKLIRKMKSKATLDDCYNLCQCCKIDGIMQSLAEIENSEAVTNLIMKPLEKSCRRLKKFTDLIETTVVFNSVTREACIKPEIDPELVEIDEALQRLNTKAEVIAESLRVENSVDNIKLETDSEIGFYMRVTLKAEKNLRKAEIIELKLGKGKGLTFSTKSLQKLSEEFCQLKMQYENQQTEVQQEVIQTCEGYLDLCTELADKISILDVLVSFSVLCSNSANQYVRPILLEEGTNVFELREFRHPIVESMTSFIPNDLVFGNSNRFVVLTGPNMGGKSTFLKAAALTVIMAQIGCFVPCEMARFSILDGIYCRVGAGDVQSQGISTFMHEMKDIVFILNSATPNSFVIIDELGRGTSTFDGFGIAYSVAEEIVCQTKSLTLFATHFHQMAQLKICYPMIVKNLKVDTYLDENGTMTILYKISEGISEKSYGITIAKMVGFPNEIVKEAENVLESFERTKVDEKELMALNVLLSCQDSSADEIRFFLKNIPTNKLH